MPKPDREARVHRAKALGRIAYRNIVNSCDVEGFVTFEGEDKHLRNFDDDGFSMVLVEPFRAAARPTEYSSLLIRYRHSKVLEIRWDKTGQFKVLRYEPGDWERILHSWPEPIPF